MKLQMIALASAALFAMGISISAFAGASLPDTDTDGVPDEWDNCLTVANPSQLDTNLDGYGNLCDGDLDNDGAVGPGDFGLFRADFGLLVPPASPDTDLDGDGAVGPGDFGLFRGLFGLLVGPSGLPCAGTIPCEGV